MKNYQLGIYEKAMPAELSWKEKFIYTREFGFDYIEMSIDETDEKLERIYMHHEQRAEILKIMLDANIRIGSICLSAHRKFALGSKEIEIQKKAIDIAKRAINLSCDLGIRLIQLAGYDVYYEKSDTDTKKTFEENLFKICEIASVYGVNMGFETMEATHNPFIDTVEKAMKYVKKINSPYLGVYPDIGNLQNSANIYGLNVSDDLQSGSGHIFAAHLKETKPNLYREVPFSTGHTDYYNNIKKLKELGVKRFVAEFWYTGQSDWEKDCKHASEFLHYNIRRS